MGSLRQPSISGLISRAVGDVRTLANAQVQLTKAEVSTNVSLFQGITVLGLVAIGLVTQAGLMLTFAAVYGLVALGLATWAAFLIVAGVFLLIAAIAGALAFAKAQKIRGPKIAQAELNKTVEAISAVVEPAPAPTRTL